MVMMMVSQGALMEYQTKRGGKVVLQDVTKPTRMEWGTPLEAVTAVLELEKTVSMEEEARLTVFQVTRTLQDLEAKATEKKDFHLVAFIQSIQGKKVDRERRMSMVMVSCSGQHHQGDG